MTITVIGTGYVGLTTAALFAHCGHKVFALDKNKNRLDTIKEGKSFFYEEGLDPLLAKAVGNNLIVTDSYSEAIPKSDFIFSCVGTPDNPDGSSNLSFVFAAAKETAKYIKSGSVYVQKSTVPVGTGAKVSKVFGRKHVSYVSNPEFLREGTGLSDSLFFDRIVAGGVNKQAVGKVIGLYKNIEKNRNKIAKLAGLQGEAMRKPRGRYIATNLDSAELIKVTSNAFLALKISFANSIAKLADHTGADVVDVMDAVGADHRIGRDFLNAGRGYGGGCFPKDVSGLISSAKQHGEDLPIMSAAVDVNDSMPGYIAYKAERALGGDYHSKQVAVLGLAFKAGTSDARRSPAINLANSLQKNRAIVSVYDPKANHEAKEELRRHIKITESIEAAVKDADAVFVATDWPEFARLDLKKLVKSMQGNLLVDCMNIFDPDDAKKAGLDYVGVGRY